MIPDGQGEAYPEKSPVSALYVSEGNFPYPEAMRGFKRNLSAIKRMKER